MSSLDVCVDKETKIIVEDKTKTSAEWAAYWRARYEALPKNQTCVHSALPEERRLWCYERKSFAMIGVCTNCQFYESRMEVRGKGREKWQR